MPILPGLPEVPRMGVNLVFILLAQSLLNRITAVGANSQNYDGRFVFFFEYLSFPHWYSS